MPVSHDLRCVFVHIPRTGGTSIEAALELLGDWRIEDTEKMFGLVTSPELRDRIHGAPFLQHVGVDVLRALRPAEYATFFRFTFVRNPWDRMVSIYSRLDPHMVTSARTVGIDLISRSFEGFVEQISEFSHVHLLPQCEFLASGTKDYGVDFVGRFERLAEDFDFVCKRLGIHRTLPHRNASRRDVYQKLYTPRSQRMVEQFYLNDIEEFGYRF